MAQDLRKLSATEREKNTPVLREGHEERFLKKLDTVLPQKKQSVSPMVKIAASLLVVLGLSWLIFQNDVFFSPDEPVIVTTEEKSVSEKKMSFGDLSPSLKKIESYYVAHISIELSKLEFATGNKELIDSFMKQLNALDNEYEDLNTELYAIGPNDQTITALIQNLQLRLQLLQKLKKKLNELKNSKNEKIDINFM